MHTFVGKNRTRIHYNSDMSGECIICNKNEESVEVSCEDIIDFIAEYIRGQKIRELEQMDSKDVLNSIDWNTLMSEAFEEFEF